MCFNLEKWKRKYKNIKALSVVVGIAGYMAAPRLRLKRKNEFVVYIDDPPPLRDRPGSGAARPMVLASGNHGCSFGLFGCLHNTHTAKAE